MGRSKIENEGWVFTGSEIRSGKIYSTISLLQSELEPNSFEAEVELKRKILSENERVQNET